MVQSLSELNIDSWPSDEETEGVVHISEMQFASGGEVRHDWSDQSMSINISHSSGNMFSNGEGHSLTIQSHLTHNIHREMPVSKKQQNKLHDEGTSNRAIELAEVLTDMDLRILELTLRKEIYNI